jgi:predicted Fe-Mo cluster-binding NifX family protein
MIVAVPIFSSRVSPRLDCSPEMLLATVKEGRIVAREMAQVNGRNPLARINWLCRQGVQVVICGGLSRFSLRMLMDRGVRVFPGVAGDVDDALRMFLAGRLQAGLFIGPGGRGRRCRRRRGSGWPPDRFSE